MFHSKQVSTLETTGESSNKVKLFFFTLFLFFALKAQGAALASTEDIARAAHLANINALLIFTSQDGLNSGLFHFTKIDAHMEIYSLPFEYTFESDSDVNYFLVGNVGYSRVFTKNELVVAAGRELSTDTHLQTYTAGIGAGVGYNLTKELNVRGGIELIYSRSGVNVKRQNEEVVGPIEDFFGNEFNDNVSYKLFFESIYKPKVEYLDPYFKVGYRFYDTKSDFSYNKFLGFSTQSSVFWASIGAQTHALYTNEYGHLTLEGYLGAHHLRGDVVSSIGFNNYSKVGAVGYWYLDDSEAWFEKFSLEVSTINAVGLEGYNIGVGFTLNY